jgi:hypothetical protein
MPHSCPDLHLLGVVLEALELLEHAVVLDDDVVAGDADERVPLDDAVGDVAAGDRADLGDLEDLRTSAWPRTS